MASMTLNMKNPQTGQVKQAPVGFSWTVFFFGMFPAFFRGDIKYGFNRTNKDASIHLHARQIEFIHPVKQEAISINAPTPKDSIWKECERD